MKILLYNPDNGVTQNFMPHLWMFLLQALTPAGHEVMLIDGNTRPMSDDELVRFVPHEGIGLVGIGAMTRMIAKAYRVADALRAAGVPRRHGRAARHRSAGRSAGARRRTAARRRRGPGRGGPNVAADRGRRRARPAQGNLHSDGRIRRGTEARLAGLPGDSLGVARYRAVQPHPGVFPPLMRHFGRSGRPFTSSRIESGRGCPYGCEFCTVTGFFGDSIRFRSNESIVDEMLRLKERARGRAARSRCFSSTIISPST